MTSRPPTTITTTLTTPTRNVVSAPTPEITRIVESTSRNNLCAPSAKTRASCFSAVYAFTIRIPENPSVSLPDTSAFTTLRCLKIGRTVLNAHIRRPPKIKNAMKTNDANRALK